MSIFELYLKLGIDHIADLKGYDHILFILSLTIIYSFRHWKKVLILVTAFTIGHSITLILATLDILKISTAWVEFLIPVTIFITALMNTLQKSDKFSSKSHQLKYFAALFFGLIHGLGFSNYLRSMLSSGEGMVKPLFAFNIGIELGQIFIVLLIMGLNVLLVDILGLKRREWILLLSGAAMGISLVLAIERLPF
jgi:hypothetical protein